jgi:hypothetical protein
MLDIRIIINNLYRDWIHLKYVLPKSEAKKLIRYAIELAAHTWTIKLLSMKH